MTSLVSTGDFLFGLRVDSEGTPWRIFDLICGACYICHRNSKRQNFKSQTHMPSFDIVSKVDAQTLDNAVNVTTKEITNRFDFKGSHVVIDLNKKEFKISIETEDEMKMRQLIDVLISRAHKQGIAPEAFDFSKEG